MPKRKDKEPNSDLNSECINDSDIDNDEYYELLSELFPSNYMNSNEIIKRILVDYCSLDEINNLDLKNS